MNFLLSILLMFSMGAYAQCPPVDEPVPEPAEVEVIVPLPVDRAETLKMNVLIATTFATRRAKYEKAVALAKKVIASKLFKDMVLAHKYNGISGFANSVESPSAVYESLLDGAERLSPAIDNEIDLEVRFYTAANSVIGYTNPSIKYINVNTKFFDRFAIPSVAANLVHEYMHKLGYGHDSSATARRPYSVPYAIGNIVRSIGTKIQ
jgi:hypothetical protein